MSSRITTWLAYALIRAHSLTFRLEVQNEHAWMEHLRAGGRVLLCTWHQQFFAAIRHFRRYRHLQPGLMISRSSDGDLIAGVARRTGWATIRGSSSRGGREALAGMIDHLGTSRLAAHIVDGPRGPAGRVKPGLIRLAHHGDASLVPFYVTASHAWTFDSWDRFFIPKPFARVVLRFGDPIRLTPTNDRQRLEEQRLQIESIMRAACPEEYGDPPSRGGLGVEASE